MTSEIFKKIMSLFDEILSDFESNPKIRVTGVYSGNEAVDKAKKLVGGLKVSPSWFEYETAKAFTYERRTNNGIKLVIFNKDVGEWSVIGEEK